MTPEQHRKLTDLFQAVMERSRSDRESFAKQLCHDDPELLPQLLRLILSADDSMETHQARFAVDGYSPSFAPNEVLLNRFRIVRFLGRGGMGEVYEADDSETGRIALKTIRPEIAASAHVLESFRREVLYARKLTGIHVCRIFELFSLPASAKRTATAFLTMEFLEGVTLTDRIRSGPPLSLSEAQNIALQICRGLQTIHDAGIVHRDLKSRNIMLAKRARGTEVVLMGIWGSGGSGDLGDLGGSGGIWGIWGIWDAHPVSDLPHLADADAHHIPGSPLRPRAPFPLYADARKQYVSDVKDERSSLSSP